MSTCGERVGLCLNAARRAAGRWLAAIACAASIAAAAEDWPQFRGPTGQGIAPGADPPVEWSPGKNVAWKRALPGPGWSSPVVNEGRVYLTCSIVAADGNPGLHLLSCDEVTGRVEWSTEIFPLAGAPLRPGHEQSQPAGATPVIEGGRIYVYFGHHGAACVDRAGKIVWRNPRLLFDPAPANAGSPVIVGDRLVYLAEGAIAPSIVALDKHTGKVLWRVRRTLPSKLKFSFGTPLAIAVGRRTQLIVPADGFVAALEPADGRELWRVRHAENYAASARPVFARGLLFVSSGYYRGELRAIRPDGAGDVTDSHVAWRTIKGAPITAGLVADGGELYAVNDAGVVTCWEADTGRVVWQERLPGNYAASPVLAGGRLYFQNDTGAGTVLRAGREFAVLATNELGEPTLASYAVAGRALFIRTAGHLYRIEGRP